MAKLTGKYFECNSKWTLIQLDSLLEYSWRTSIGRWADGRLSFGVLHRLFFLVSFSAFRTGSVWTSCRKQEKTNLTHIKHQKTSLVYIYIFFYVCLILLWEVAQFETYTHISKETFNPHCAHIRNFLKATIRFWHILPQLCSAVSLNNSLFVWNCVCVSTWMSIHGLHVCVYYPSC